MISITLATANSFLTIIQDTSHPYNNGFTIQYIPNTDESYIGIHTVTYTVSSKDYSSSVPSINGSFNFEIKCSDSAYSVNLVTPVADLVYSLGTDNTLNVTPPTVTFIPNSCFSISTY